MIPHLNILKNQQNYSSLSSYKEQIIYSVQSHAQFLPHLDTTNTITFCNISLIPTVGKQQNYKILWDIINISTVGIKFPAN